MLYRTNGVRYLLSQKLNVSTVMSVAAMPVLVKFCINSTINVQVSYFIGTARTRESIWPEYRLSRLGIA